LRDSSIGDKVTPPQVEQLQLLVELHKQCQRIIGDRRLCQSQLAYGFATLCEVAQRAVIDLRALRQIDVLQVAAMVGEVGHERIGQLDASLDTQQLQARECNAIHGCITERWHRQTEREREQGEQGELGWHMNEDVHLISLIHDGIFQARGTEALQVFASLQFGNDSRCDIDRIVEHQGSQLGIGFV
jgi:hypothetical protein